MKVTVADLVGWSGATLEGGRDATVIEGATADSRDITPATYKATSIFSPSKRQDSPLTLVGLATSNLKLSAPKVCNVAQPASSRAVASTRQPSDTYCLANSKPMPREAPKMRTVGIARCFQ